MLLLLDGHLVVGVFILFLPFFIFAFSVCHLLGLVVFVSLLLGLFPIHFVFLVDVLLDLVLSSFHELACADGLQLLLLLHLRSQLLGHLGTAFLHQRLTSVLGWEVSCGDIKAVIILS